MTTGLLLFGYVTKGEMWLIVPFIITFSLGWGCSVTTRLSVIREHFGRGSFGTILGFMAGIMMLGNIAGTPLAGWIFDTWGSYQGAWLGFSAVIFLCVILTFSISSPGSTIQKSDKIIAR